MDKCIFVTGSAGFIGSNFVINLFNNRKYKYYKIISLDKLTYAGSTYNLSLAEKN